MDVLDVGLCLLKHGSLVTNQLSFLHNVSGDSSFVFTKNRMKKLFWDAQEAFVIYFLFENSAMWTICWSHFEKH